MGLFGLGFSPRSWLIRPAASRQRAPGEDSIPRESETPSQEDRVRRAFAEIPLSPRERQALSALLEADRGATAGELGERCGWMAGAWHTQMLLLCHRRRHVFWPEGLGSDITNGMILAALSDYDSQTLRFRARPELTEILRRAVDAAG